MASLSGLLPVLLVLCSFAPGFYVVRKFRWSPVEKLAGSIALSLIFLYLAAFGLYCFAPGGISRGASAAVSILCAVLAVHARADIARLFAAARVRRIAAGYGFLFVWVLVFLAMIRNYSGLGWGADWLEHFQRTLFFLHRLPVDTPILFGYEFPARPPMMNLLAAFFLAQTQDSFALVQVVFTFFNLLLFIPCCLMLPALGVSRRTRILPLVLLFAASPVVFVHATYLWTKSLTVFYVVLAYWFYLAARRKQDSKRMIAAFVALAAGLLVHYSAGPHLVVLAVHYVVTLWKRPERWRELAAIAVVCGFLLATWFGWSLATYGTKKTLQSNTSVTAARDYKGSAAVRIARNISDTFVPFLLRGRLVTDQRNSAGLVRDLAFTIYHPNLIFGMGILGGPVVLWLLFRAARRRPPEWRFWRVAIPAAVVLGIVVVGERDVFGSAHLTLIPLVVLGLSMIASAFPGRRVLAAVVLAGCLIDFYFGVWLQARVESLENSPGRMVFSAGARTTDGGIQRGELTPETLSVAAWENWFLKHKFELAQEFLGKLESFRSADGGENLVATMGPKLERDMREDSTMWGDWWSRHQYRLRFLGDDALSLDDILPPLAGVLGLALLVLVVWDLRTPKPKQTPAPASRAARR